MYIDYDPKKHGNLPLLELQTVEENGSVLTTAVPFNGNRNFADEAPWYYVVNMPDTVESSNQV